MILATTPKPIATRDIHMRCGACDAGFTQWQEQHADGVWRPDLATIAAAHGWIAIAVRSGWACCQACVAGAGGAHGNPYEITAEEAERRQAVKQALHPVATPPAPVAFRAACSHCHFDRSVDGARDVAHVAELLAAEGWVLLYGKRYCSQSCAQWHRAPPAPPPEPVLQSAQLAAARVSTAHFAKVRSLAALPKPEPRTPRPPTTRRAG